MDKNAKKNSAAPKKAEKKPVDKDEEKVCTKPFDSENARTRDKDEPCSNGEG